jgi:hypothetical protein
MQRRAGEQLVGVAQLRDVRRAAGHLALLFGGAQGQPGFFIQIGQQHVFHGLCLHP